MKNFIPLTGYKRILAIAASILLISAIVLSTIFFIIPALQYSRAQKLIDKGEYKKAYNTLIGIIDYKDSREKLKNFDIKYEKMTRTEIGVDGEEKVSTYEYSYDKYGNLLTENCYNADDSLSYSKKREYEYDKNGNVILDKAYEDGALAYFNKFEYDSEGRKILSEDYFTNGNISSRSKYDEHGSQILYENFYEDGRLSSRHTYKYTYDKIGNVTLKESFDANGSQAGSVKNEYNRNGKLKSSQRCLADGSVYSSSESKFDENGNEVLCEYFGQNGQLMHYVEYKYYDDGSCKEEKRFDSAHNVTYETTYDEHGNKTLEKSYDENGDINAHMSYAYDAYGNLIAYKEHDKSGKVKYKAKYKHNKYGLDTSWICFDGNGKQTYERKNEYENILFFYNEK